jgi:cysteine desulfurase
MTYLDWASTSPPHEDVLVEAARLAANAYGNPSSRHGLGLEAQARLEEARSILLGTISGASVEGAPSGKHAGPKDDRPRLVFTSGGSESDAMVLLSFLRRRDSRTGSPPHIVTTSIEHSAIHEECRLLEGLGLPVTFVDPEADGLVRPEAIAAALRKDTALVAVMAVNNETGAIQPLAGIAQALRSASQTLGRHIPPFFHSDAVQALGKIPFAPANLGLNSAAFSAHKLRGPRGCGALWLAGRLDPLVVGGGQEGGQRPGTENLQGAWAFARAAALASSSLEARTGTARRLEARIIEGLSAIPGVLPLPLGREAGDPRYSPFILSAAFPGLSGEVLARDLADRGMAVSTGAACSNRGAHKGRRVLDAMGLPADLSFSAIRVSTGELSTEADIDAFLEAAAAAYKSLKT